MKKMGAAIISIAVVLIIEGGFFVYNSYISSPNTATVDMKVADLPLANVSAVYITFSAVEVHGNNSSGWKYFNLSKNKTIDILDLTVSNASLLSSVKLTAQTYTMFRLYITNVTVVTKLLGPINFTLASSFGFLNHPVTIKAGSTSSIIFEFNLTQDINLSSHIFTPNLGIEVIS